MQSIFENLLANLNPNPETKPEEKLNFSELKSFLIHEAIVKERKKKLKDEGLHAYLLNIIG